MPRTPALPTIHLFGFFFHVLEHLVTTFDVAGSKTNAFSRSIPAFERLASHRIDRRPFERCKLIKQFDSAG